jgi:hypothetical protein
MRHWGRRTGRTVSIGWLSPPLPPTCRATPHAPHVDGATVEGGGGELPVAVAVRVSLVERRHQPSTVFRPRPHPPMASLACSANAVLRATPVAPRGASNKQIRAGTPPLRKPTLPPVELALLRAKSPHQYTVSGMVARRPITHIARRNAGGICNPNPWRAAGWCSTDSRSSRIVRIARRRSHGFGRRTLVA